MASIMSQLGIEEEVLAQVKPESVYEGKTLPPALYSAEVNQAYIRQTDSGAKMLEVDFILPPTTEGGEPTPYHYATCVMSGDEKGNKTTYTSKQGKEVALPGVVAMTKFLTSIDSIAADGMQGEVMHRDQKIKAMCLTGIQGKKLRIGVIQEENFYQGNVLLKNDVKYWLNEQGENSAGDTLIDKVVESIEKYPIKKLKTGTTTTAPATGTAAAPSNSGW